MLAAILALLLATPPAFATRIDPSLEGTAWKLTLDRLGLPDGVCSSDLLVFTRGRFAALEYLSLGYEPGTYRVQADAQGLHWTAALSAPGGNLVVFDGTRRGRKMTGFLRWQDTAGRFREIPFKAVIRPQPLVLPPGL